MVAGYSVGRRGRGNHSKGIAQQSSFLTLSLPKRLASHERRAALVSATYVPLFCGTCGEHARRSVRLTEGIYLPLGSLPPIPVARELILKILDVFACDTGIHEFARFIQQRQHNSRRRCNGNTLRIAYEAEKAVVLQVRPRQNLRCGSNGDARRNKWCCVGHDDTQLQRGIGAEVRNCPTCPKPAAKWG